MLFIEEQMRLFQLLEAAVSPWLLALFASHPFHTHVSLFSVCRVHPPGTT